MCNVASVLYKGVCNIVVCVSVAVTLGVMNAAGVQAVTHSALGEHAAHPRLKALVLKP